MFWGWWAYYLFLNPFTFLVCFPVCCAIIFCFAFIKPLAIWKEIINLLIMKAMDFLKKPEDKKDTTQKSSLIIQQIAENIYNSPWWNSYQDYKLYKLQSLSIVLQFAMLAWFGFSPAVIGGIAFTLICVLTETLTLYTYGQMLNLHESLYSYSSNYQTVYDKFFMKHETDQEEDAEKVMSTKVSPAIAAQEYYVTIGLKHEQNERSASFSLNQAYSRVVEWAQNLAEER